MKGQLGFCSGSGAVIYSCFWRLIEQCFRWTVHRQISSLNILIRTPQDLGVVQAHVPAHVYFRKQLFFEPSGVRIMSNMFVLQDRYTVYLCLAY